MSHSFPLIKQDNFINFLALTIGSESGDESAWL